MARLRELPPDDVRWLAVPRVRWLGVSPRMIKHEGMRLLFWAVGEIDEALARAIANTATRSIPP